MPEVLYRLDEWPWGTQGAYVGQTIHVSFGGLPFSFGVPKVSQEKVCDRPKERAWG